MVKKVEAFDADDGTVFPSMSEAAGHDLRLGITSPLSEGSFGDMAATVKEALIRIKSEALTDFLVTPNVAPRVQELLTRYLVATGPSSTTEEEG